MNAANTKENWGMRETHLVPWQGPSPPLTSGSGTMDRVPCVSCRNRIRYSASDITAMTICCWRQGTTETRFKVLAAINMSVMDRAPCVSYKSRIRESESGMTAVMICFWRCGTTEICFKVLAAIIMLVINFKDGASVNLLTMISRHCSCHVYDGPLTDFTYLFKASIVEDFKPKCFEESHPDPYYLCRIQGSTVGL